MVRIEGATRSPRNEMIARVSQALQNAGADIIDHRFYSNLTMFVSAEIEGSKISALREALNAAGLRLSDATEIVCPGVIPFHLVITFIHEEPDMRISVPAIPG